MKFLITLIIMVCFLLLPMSAFGDPIYAAVSTEGQSPTAVHETAVAPPLVREGDFAVQLAKALKTGTSQSETTAESRLAAIGIAPHNGWIADYPVTPEIIDQLQNSIKDAVDSGKLSMSTTQAMTALRTVSDGFGLNIVAGKSNGNQGAGEPSAGSSANASPAVVNNYYYENGPPVITYYSPPPAFIYLYAWVPCPFWFASFYFPGFFILNDFDTYVIVHHRTLICTNHVFNRRSGRFFLINPVNGRYYRSVREFPHVRRFGPGRGGEAIYHHDFAHYRVGGTRIHNGYTRSGLPGPRDNEWFRRPAPEGRNNFGQRMNGGHEGSHFGHSGEGRAFGAPSGFGPSFPASSPTKPHGRSFAHQGAFGGFHGDHPEGFHGNHFGGFQGTHPEGFHGNHFGGFQGTHPEGFHDDHFGGFHGDHPEGFHGDHPEGFHGGHFGGFHGDHPEGFHGGHFGGFHGDHPEGFHGGHFGGFQGAHFGGGHGFHGGGFGSR